MKNKTEKNENTNPFMQVFPCINMIDDTVQPLTKIFSMFVLVNISTMIPYKVQPKFSQAHMKWKFEEKTKFCYETKWKFNVVDRVSTEREKDVTVGWPTDWYQTPFDHAAWNLTRPNSSNQYTKSKNIKLFIFKASSPGITETRDPRDGHACTMRMSMIAQWRQRE